MTKKNRAKLSRIENLKENVETGMQINGENGSTARERKPGSGQRFHVFTVLHHSKAPCDLSGHSRAL